jgi:hypothetical protein
VLLVLLYFNQRVRKEGYDVERMIEVAGLAVPVPEPAVEAVPEPVAVQAANPSAKGSDPQAASESLA